MIIRNAIRCHGCGETIESKHLNDLVWCKCLIGLRTKCAVNGGLEKLIRAGFGDWDELAEFSTGGDRND